MKKSLLMGSALFAVLLTAQVSKTHAETITVTNTNDTGAGSLRQAIIDANADPTFTNITFNIPGSSTHTIAVAGSLPALTAPVDITVPGIHDEVVIEPYSGVSATYGFKFDAGSTGSTLKNITVNEANFGVDILVNNITIESVKLLQTNGIAVRLNTVSGISITRSTISSTYSSSPALSGNVSDLTFKGNFVTNQPVILYTVSNSVIGGVGQFGQNFFNGGGVILANATNVVFEVNTVYNTVLSVGNLGAVQVVNGNNVTVGRSTFTNNEGFDIHIQGTGNTVSQNNITGNGDIYSGVYAHHSSNLSVYQTTFNAAALQLLAVTNSNFYQLNINTDPQGVSAYGAVQLDSSNGNSFRNIEVNGNASNGVLLNQSSNNSFRQSAFINNGRTGIRLYGGDGNLISQNVIFDNHADAGGFKAGISLNSANLSKAAPVITSLSRSGNIVTLSGTTSASGDSIEIFRSDSASTVGTFTKNAREFLTKVKASGTSWTAIVDVSSFPGATGFFTATATDAAKNTSEFSVVKRIYIRTTIVGPTSVVAGSTHNYSIPSLPGVTYTWWISGDGNVISGAGTNAVTINFTSWYSGGSVNVGFTDPDFGWTVWTLPVSVYSPRFASDVPVADVYPNPFTNNLTVNYNAGLNNTLRLFDTQGNVVFTQDNFVGGNEIELGDKIPAGNYLLQVTSGGSTKSAQVYKK